MGNFRQEYFSIKKSGFFDSQFYFQSYPDVKNAGLEPLKHYILHGWKEGRNPSPDFETNYYLTTYPDIKQSGINPLFHYVKHGHKEGRSINSRHDTVLIPKKITGIEKLLFLSKQANIDKSLIKKLIITVAKKGIRFAITKTNSKVKKILLEKYSEYKYRKQKDFFEIKVSVIIPTYNRSKLLPKLLEAWKKVDKVTRYNYELIFSDDGSDDGSVAIFQNAKGLPLKIIKNKHGGAAKARNSAILAAKGEKLLIMGDDIFPNPEIINQHYEKLQELPVCKAVLGEIIWHKDIEVNMLMKHITEIGQEQFSFNAFNPHEYIDFRHFYTSNISIDRAFVLSEKIIFDEQFYKVNFEDIELGFRLSKKGMEIYYYPEAHVEHYHPYKSISSFCKRQETAGEMAVVFKKLHNEESEWFTQVDTILKQWNTYLLGMTETALNAEIIKDVVNICQYIEDSKEVNRMQVEHHLSQVYRVVFRFYYEKGIVHQKLKLNAAVYDQVFYCHYWPNVVENLKHLNEIIELPGFKKHLNIKQLVYLTILVKDLEHIEKLRSLYENDLKYIKFLLPSQAIDLPGDNYVYAPEADFLLHPANMSQLILFFQLYPKTDVILLSLGLNDLPAIGISEKINNNFIYKYSNHLSESPDINTGKIIRLISEKCDEAKDFNFLFPNGQFEINAHGFFYKSALSKLPKKSIFFERYDTLPKTKKTAFVFPIFLAVGGVERNTVEAISRLTDEYDFIVVTFERLAKPQGSLHHQFLKTCKGIYDLTELSSHDDILIYLEALRNAYSPDLVWICNGSPWLAASTLNIRKLFNSAAIVDQQVYDTTEGWVQLYKAKDQGLLAFDRFIAINSKIKEVFENTAGIASDHIDLIYSTLSLEKREQAIQQENKALRKKYNLNEFQKYFVFVGRLTKQKAPMDLLKLIKLITAKYKGEYKFILVGSGEMSEQADQYIAKNDLAASIIRHNYIENTFELSKISEAIIFTSLYEGLSIALLEALSVGTPGISTDVGDTKLIFEKFGNGLVFSTIGNVEEYFLKFEEFLQKKDSLKSNAINTKEEVAKMFSPSNISLQYRECFTTAINNRLRK
ncbi:glycosyltransferase [Lacibacter luteus]|uniref:Glycosyltransferase n=1 Tax=Lacibacter luteus TaxID=2508719 RepID=A0A4Q1CIN0_9BACT|nr:glycosyltransferase [Lacibacter luteus]RXK60021.1 glycosyltransferase [Lacibacter luteus]